MAEGAIEITSVITQFRESESLLEEVRERLKAIALSEEGAAGARGSLESAAGSLGESVASLRAVVEEIAAVEGVDMMLIGTNDLTAEWGIPGQYDDPRVAAAYERTIAACRRHGKHVGVGGLGSRPDLVEKFPDRTLVASS